MSKWLLVVLLAGCGPTLAEKIAKEPGAQKYKSGLIMRTLEPGAGQSPGPKDRVKVHYHGTLDDGTVFDSSVQRGSAAEFPLDRVIPCWTEALTHMKEGEKARIVCPSELAYGEKGTGTIPGNATLFFDVELLQILH